MKLIKNKIRIITRLTCNHDFERFAFYYKANKEIVRCTKCDKRKEIEH